MVLERQNMSKRPRISVFRSNKYIYCQIIDDETGKTLVAASGKQPSQVGRILAQKALKKGIKKVWFDRGRYKYHGRVKALAEEARKGGLKF